MPEVLSREEAKARGLVRFFTGKPCKHGHVAERFVSGRVCCECQKVNSRIFASRHPERVAQNRSVQKAKNASYFRDYYARNREARKAQASAWYEANKDRALRACRDWAERNRDKVREMGRRSRRKRRAIQANVGGSHTAADLDRIFQRQRGKCALCKCSLAAVAKELDHIIPISRGGDNNPGNLQWLCRPCNRSKSNKDPIEFARERGALL